MSKYGIKWKVSSDVYCKSALECYKISAKLYGTLRKDTS